MKQQLIVYNPNDGKVWEMGKKRNTQIGERLLDENATTVYPTNCEFVSEYPMTPLDPATETARQFRLMREVWKACRKS